MSTQPNSPDGGDTLRIVFEAAPNAMVLVGSDGGIQLVNQQTETMFGYRRSELLGQSVEILLPQRFRAQHPHHRESFFASPSTRAMGAGRELFGRRRDGSEVPLEIGLNPIRTADGISVLASIIDISQRHQLEETLRQSEERLRAVVEAAPNAMIMIDQGGIIRLVNEQAERMFGHQRGDMLGQPVEILVPPRFRDDHPGRRSAYLRDPTVRAMGAGRELFGLRRDGTEVPLEIGLNPIRTPEGPFVLAAIIDITQRKRSDDLLRASLAEKETLLREIHHRVKNNMQVISSMLSLQSSYVDDPRYRAMFGECEARVRAMALIHEKLYGATNLMTIDFGGYIRELAEMLLPSYSAGRVQLQLDTQAVSVDIHCAIPLGLILNELVTNSLKHAFPQRDGTIRIGLSRRTDGLCVMTVQDDGVGVPHDFDQRQDRGLGLRMIRGLVRQLGGELEFVKEPAPGIHCRIAFGTAERSDQE